MQEEQEVAGVHNFRDAAIAVEAGVRMAQGKEYDVEQSLTVEEAREQLSAMEIKMAKFQWMVDKSKQVRGRFWQKCWCSLVADVL
jgi:hypothetical protein